MSQIQKLKVIIRNYIFQRTKFNQTIPRTSLVMFEKEKKSSIRDGVGRKNEENVHSPFIMWTKFLLSDLNQRLLDMSETNFDFEIL